jgi:gas vesicle protein
VTLLQDFRRWLIQKRIDDIEELKKQEKKHDRFQIVASQNQERKNRISEIKAEGERVQLRIQPHSHS